MTSPHSPCSLVAVGSAALLLLLAPFLAGPAQAQAPARPRAQAPGTPTARPEPQSWDFGDQVAVRQCLRFSVSDYRDRQGDVDNHDWVHLKVENACPTTISTLLVELLLVDTRAQRYGTPVWVLGQGERLRPGEKWEDDVAIPDPDSRVARRWTMRVLQVQGLPKPPPVQKKG